MKRSRRDKSRMDGRTVYVENIYCLQFNISKQKMNIAEQIFLRLW